MRRFALFAALSFLPAFAGVVTVRVLERTDIAGGKSFGTAGPYERIVARAEFAVDPKLSANQNITDLALAPRNEQGLVEFTADVVVLKPREPKQGNGTAFVDIPNRGGETYGSMQREDFLLFQQGFTIVDVGWQFDVPQRPGLLRLNPPSAMGVTGLVRGQFVPDHPATSFLVSDRNHVPYAAIDQASAKLYVRDKAESEPRLIPRTAWHFSDSTHVEYTAGFEPGKLYEVVYKAENPPIAGLGEAAIRDFVSFLKYGGGDSTSVLGEKTAKIDRAIAFGASQSGRFLRTYLYDGFNADEKGRKVLDGVMAHVAGAGRGSFNIRFAQPSRDGHPLMNLYYPSDVFPFTDLPESDPETGVTAGLLDRMDPKVRPKIFYTNGSYEYWGRAASLIHTTADGKQDVPLPPDTRIYYLAGTQHGAGAKEARNGTQNLANPMDYRWALRALLIAMQQWIKDGAEPPPSQYPKVGKDQLVSIGAVNFPKIAGVELPKTKLHAWHLDFSTEPPTIGKEFPTLVPQVDGDGNETAGVRLPELAAPLATYSGWNLRDSKIGAPDMIANMIGSYIPFARTKAERLKNGDPRPSIEERYASKDVYMQQVTTAAGQLVKSRYLLEGDVPAIREKASARWDALMHP